MKEINMKALMTDNGKLFLHKSGDMHTQYGFVKAEIIENSKPGTVVKTNTGSEMTVLEAGFLDLYKKMKRGAQIIPLKDIGKIIAETGMSKKSVVLDAGSGSGAVCCFAANIAKKVYTYEIRDDFAGIVKKNIDFLGLKNVVMRKKDIYDGISEKNIDIMILDLPEPWKVIPHALKAVKVGGYIVSYSPTIPQVSDFVEEVRRTKGFVHLKTTETIEREWDIEGRKIRPKSQPIGHSGFMSFVRRI